jgi:hypothetical protein
MNTVFVDTGPIPSTPPIHLSFHVVATLRIAAEQARR